MVNCAASSELKSRRRNPPSDILTRQSHYVIDTHVLQAVCNSDKSAVISPNNHGRRSVGGQGSFSPDFLQSRGCPVFRSPYFFGGRHFCTNAHGIHRMIGAIFIKFSQLIIMKIIKIVATRCQIFRPKCSKFNFSWGYAADPAGGAYSAPPDP